MTCSIGRFPEYKRFHPLWPISSCQLVSLGAESGKGTQSFTCCPSISS